MFFFQTAKMVGSRLCTLPYRLCDRTCVLWLSANLECGTNGDLSV